MKVLRINRIKAVSAENGKTNKWLAARLGKNITSVSRWCTKDNELTLETLLDMVRLLKADVSDSVNPTRVKGKTHV